MCLPVYADGDVHVCMCVWSCVCTCMYVCVHIHTWMCVLCVHCYWAGCTSVKRKSNLKEVVISSGAEVISSFVSFLCCVCASVCVCICVCVCRFGEDWLTVEGDIFSASTQMPQNQWDDRKRKKMQILGRETPLNLYIMNYHFFLEFEPPKDCVRVKPMIEEKHAQWGEIKLLLSTKLLSVSPPWGLFWSYYMRSSLECRTLPVITLLKAETHT